MCGVCSSGMVAMQREVSGRLFKYGLELHMPYTLSNLTVSTKK